MVLFCLLLRGLGADDILLWALVMTVGIATASKDVVGRPQANMSISLLSHVMHSLAHWMGWIRQPHWLVEEPEAEVIGIPEAIPPYDVKMLHSQSS